MLIPGAGFIPLIMSIWDTIKVFVEKLATIAAVVKSYVDSIVAIAAGEIGGAAKRVEAGFQSMLTLAISFFATIAGLGGIPSKVKEAVGKLREMVDHALDTAITWLIGKAKALGLLALQAGVPTDPKERLQSGMQAAVAAVDKFAGKKVGSGLLAPLLGVVKLRYGFTSLEVVAKGERWAVSGKINPGSIAFTRVIVGTDDADPDKKVTIVDPPKILVFEFSRFTANQTVSINEMTEGLQHHQEELNSLTVSRWLANIYFRPFLRGAIAAEERDLGRRALIAQVRADVTKEYADKNITLSAAELNNLIALRIRGAHASHSADFIAGGDIDKFDSLERGAVNSYIGSNWGRFRPELESYAISLRQNYDPKDWDAIKMNFRLRVQFRN
jgi:hypothetical protein